MLAHRSTRRCYRARFPSRSGLGLLLLATMLMALGGCREFMAEPAPAGATLALTFDQALATQATGSPCPLPQPAGGLERAFDRADSIRVRLTGSVAGEFRAVAGLRRSDGDGWLSIFVDDLQGTRETRQLVVDLLVRIGDERRQAVLFSDSAGVELRRGAITRVGLTLNAIADEVQLSTSTVPAAALGDTVQLCGVVLFASGDTIPSVLPVWRTLDPAVVEVSPTGRMIALAEGEGRLVGEYEQSADTVRVTVSAIPVSLSISPGRDTLDVGERRVLRGELRDARGNELVGRDVRWSSSNPAVAVVSPDVGLLVEVTADAPGIATITALHDDGGTSGPLSATAEITVRAVPPPPAPVVVTTTATDIGERSAVLRGAVNPSGVSTQAWFEWGSTPDLGSTTPAQSVGSGTAALPVSAALTDLTPGTQFYFRAAASSAGGTVRGSTLQFRTGEVPVPPAPVVVTTTATDIGERSAVLRGTVNPSGVSTQAWFEWGSTPDLGSTTPVQSVGSGTAPLPVSAALTDLTPGTLYYFRAAASSAGGTVRGSTLQFRTGEVPVPPPPVVVTRVATDVGERSAVLRGTVNPSGVSTQAWFEWGSTPDLGSTTPAQSVGSGTNALPISAALAELAPGTLYYFRAAASNAGGTVRGSTLQFRTEDVPVPPPHGLSARAIVMTLGLSVELSWDYAAESPDSFQVYHRYERGDSIATDWSWVNTQPGSARTWRHDGLDPLATHFYRMRAVVGDRVSEFSESVSARLDRAGAESAPAAERHAWADPPPTHTIRRRSAEDPKNPDPNRPRPAEHTVRAPAQRWLGAGSVPAPGGSAVQPGASAGLRENGRSR
jgi:hypothetical protein